MRRGVYRQYSLARRIVVLYCAVPPSTTHPEAASFVTPHHAPLFFRSQIKSQIRPHLQGVQALQATMLPLRSTGRIRPSHREADNTMSSSRHRDEGGFRPTTSLPSVQPSSSPCSADVSASNRTTSHLPPKPSVDPSANCLTS